MQRRDGRRSGWRVEHEQNTGIWMRGMSGQSRPCCCRDSLMREEALRGSWCHSALLLCSLFNYLANNGISVCLVSPPVIKVLEQGEQRLKPCGTQKSVSEASSFKPCPVLSASSLGQGVCPSRGLAVYWGRALFRASAFRRIRSEGQCPV